MDTQVHTWVQFKTNWMLLQTVSQSCRTYMCIPCKRWIKHGHHCISIFRLNMQRYDLTMKSVVFTKGICLHTFACMRMREHTHTHTHTHTQTHACTQTHNILSACAHLQVCFFSAIPSKWHSYTCTQCTMNTGTHAEWQEEQQMHKKTPSILCNMFSSRTAKDWKTSGGVTAFSFWIHRPANLNPVTGKVFQPPCPHLVGVGVVGEGRGCSVPALSKCVTLWPRLPFSIHTRQASQSHCFILSLLHDLYQSLHACLLCDDGVARVTAVIQLNQVSVFHACEVWAFLCYHV